MKYSATYLVELVNQTHSLIGENQRAGLQRPLARDWVPLNIRGQTNGRRALTGGEHNARCGLLDVLKEL